MAKSTEIAMFELPEVPAEIADFFEQESNVKPRASIPTLSPGGKKWTIFLNGEETVLTKKDADGDYVPVQIFRGVVLAHAEQRGRTYYEQGYDPAKPGRPDCWSDDGVKPNPSSPDLQAAKCAACPQAVKGSKVTDAGKDTKACTEYRLLAVIPSNRLDFEPLRLKLSITSDYDGKSPDHEQSGWYSWGRYKDHLISRLGPGAHTARVVTKIKFDSTVTYPKLLFSAERRLEPEELIEVVKILKGEKEKLSTLTSQFIDTTNESPKTADPDEDETPPPKPKPKPKVPDDDDETPPPKPKPTKAPVVEPEEPAPKPKPKPKAVDPDEDAEVPPSMRAKPAEEKLKPKPTLRVVDPDEDETPPPKPKTKPAAVDPDEEKPAKTPAKGNIKALLADWE